MKKIKLCIMAILVSVLVMSCSKSGVDSTSVETNSTPKPNYVSVGVTLKITAKLRRQTDDRPRDGKDCSCLECFGVCDFGAEVDLDLTQIIIIVNPITNIGRLYVLEDLDYSETEFGVDQNMPIPVEELVGTNLESLTFLEGEYMYHEFSEQVNYNNESFLSYGYVDIPVEM